MVLTHQHPWAPSLIQKPGSPLLPPPPPGPPRKPVPMLLQPLQLSGRQHVTPFGHRQQRQSSIASQQQAVASTFETEMTDYIASGPLLPLCGINQQAVSGNIEEWLKQGDFLIDLLHFPPKEQLNTVQRMRIYQYYLPVYFWCLQQLELHRRKNGAGQPLILGMQAPQGCGKTTLVEALDALFAHNGVRGASCSIDDFYLTFADQQALAQANPGNRLLQVRGNAGTHDLALGTQTLQALHDANLGGSNGAAEIAVPRYDKSQNGGRGDRAQPATWPRVQGPLDIVLFEGWMLGFRPVPDAQAQQVDADLAAINDKLHAYEAAWDSFVDAWLVVKVSNPQWVYAWRLQAEHAMLASGKPGMTDDQVADFVDRYMPAYKAYLPGMYAAGPTTARPQRTLMLEIDESRGLMPTQPACPM